MGLHCSRNCINTVESVCFECDYATLPKPMNFEEGLDQLSDNNLDELYFESLIDL